MSSWLFAQMCAQGREGKVKAPTMIKLNHYYRLRKRARVLQFGRALFLGAVTFVFFALLGRFLEFSDLYTRIVFWVIFLVVVLSVLRSNSFLYSFGEKSMIVRSGVIFSGRDVIPYRHIVSVYTTRAVVGHFFGLLVLHLHVPRAEGWCDPCERGEVDLLCARRGSDEIVFLSTPDDARDIASLVKQRIKLFSS